MIFYALVSTLLPLILLPYCLKRHRSLNTKYTFKLYINLARFETAGPACNTVELPRIKHIFRRQQYSSGKLLRGNPFCACVSTTALVYEQPPGYDQSSIELDRAHLVVPIGKIATSYTYPTPPQRLLLTHSRTIARAVDRGGGGSQI